MTTNTFAKRQREITKPERSDRLAEHSWSWLMHGFWIGAACILILLWSGAGGTTTAGDHCRRTGAGSDSCALAAAEPFVTCGWLKCGGLFSSAEESTSDRLVRQDRMQRAAEKEKRARERVERALQGELSGENRIVKGNRLD